MQVLCINEEVARLRSGARISEKCLDLQQQRAKRQAGADDTAAPNGSKAKVRAANACSLQDLHVYTSALLLQSGACLAMRAAHGEIQASKAEHSALVVTAESRAPVQLACNVSHRRARAGAAARSWPRRRRRAPPFGPASWRRPATWRSW